jgi:uncharacterized membrane protein
MTLNEIWPRLHGASTHFPVALVPLAACFEALALFVRGDEWRRRLRACAALLVPLAALGAIAAVVSGLGTAHGELLGSGSMRMHHLFVWPAFGLLVAIAMGRMLLGADAPARALAIYRVALFVNTALILGAGYWGGELVLSH